MNELDLKLSFKIVISKLNFYCHATLVFSLLYLKWRTRRAELALSRGMAPVAGGKMWGKGVGE
jgi:hypothetical protein